MSAKNDFSYEIEIYKKYYTHERGIFVVSFFEHCLNCYSIMDIFRQYEIGENREVTISSPIRTRFNNGYKKHTLKMRTVTLQCIEKLIEILQEKKEKRSQGKGKKALERVEKHLDWVKTAYNFCLALQNSYE